MNRARAGISVVEPRAGVSYVLPVAAVSYIEIVAGVTLDTEGRYPYVIDTYAVADSAIVAFAKSVQDGAASSDDIESFLIDKGLDDSITTEEFIEILKITLLDLVDTYTANDLFAALFETTKAELVSVSDERLLAYNKESAETVTASDSNSVGLDRPTADTTVATDDSTVDHGKTHEESISAADVFDRELVWSRGLTETTPAEDLFAADLAKPASDSVGITDDSIQSLAYARSFADEVSFNTGVGGLLNVYALNENLVNSNSQLIETVSIEYDKGESDSVATVDVFDRVVSFLPSYADSFAIDELLATALNKALSESISASDSVDIGLSLIRTVGDTYQAEDALAISISRGQISDSVSASDSFSSVLSQPDPALLNANVLNKQVLNASF